MTSKYFCLKWNNFQCNILNAFESLQNSEDLTDVTLTCEGINLKAHRFILSACSPYFRTVFKENPCSHPIVILKDVLYVDLIAIINFMYHGEVLVSEEQLSSFLQTAKLLQVSGLNNEVQTKRTASPKKVKQQMDIFTYPTKKQKIIAKPKITKTLTANNDIMVENATASIEVTNHHRFSNPGNTTKMETNNDEEEEICADINENVEVLVTEKCEQQSSLLEAALEPKSASILERSLTSQGISGKSLIVQPKSPLTVLTELARPAFIPRKPPEDESELPQHTPPDVLQRSIKIEDDSYNSSASSPEDCSLREPTYQIHGCDVQPHHSSQCGNCPHCGKVYSNQSALKYHVRLVHSDLTNMYCCHLCPESFDYREGYKKHMVEVHCIRN